MLVDSIQELIGNTPILKISPEVHGLRNFDLYAKLEYFNPFGSVKDRIAWGILKDSLEVVKSKSQGIIENSSGNTAKALAVLAAMNGVPFRLVTAMAKVPEVKDMLRLLGAEIEEVPGAVNCFDPNDPNDPQYLIQREVAASRGSLLFTSQFSNPKNPETHFETTGPEILQDLGTLDVFSSGLGTTGSTGGIVRFLRSACPNLLSIGITSSTKDFIPGIRSADQILSSGIFDRALYNEFVTVESSEAIDGMMELIKKCGILCGPSSGAHYAGTLRYLKKIDTCCNHRRSALFIVCDRTEWYLSYIRERRPELFQEKARSYSMTTLTEEEIYESSEIDFKDLASWTDNNRPLIIDIRTRTAFDLGTLPSAINIPSEILEKLLERPTPFVSSTQPILFLCAVGIHSRKFAAQLCRIGGKGYSLKGGIRATRS